MLRALDEFEIEGVTTLIAFHKALLRTEQWQRAETCRDLLENARWLKSLTPEAVPAKEDSEAPADEQVERDYTVEVNNRRFSVKVIGPPSAGSASANSAALRPPPRRERASGSAATPDGATDTLVSPIQGTVLRVNVEKGQEVDTGAVICVIEAMKMENEITAPRSGIVEALNVAEGGSVDTGETIAVIK
jgi:acetyl-CoA/propionyl-CoA carboxylase biotin carboxyl carrier protein